VRRLHGTTPECVSMCSAAVAVRADPMRLAYLATHPIQYQVPPLSDASSAIGLRLRRPILQRLWVRPSYDVGFKRTIQFDVPLLSGYTYKVLRNIATRPGPSPLGRVNPAIIPILASGAFDALVVHGYWFATGIMCLAAPRRRTRLLLRGEANLLTTSPSSVTGVAKYLVRRARFRRVDHFLSIGTNNSNYYRAYEIGDERITVAPILSTTRFFSSVRKRPGAIRILRASGSACRRGRYFSCSSRSSFKRSALSTS
jgi:hypothetical protein